MTNFAAIDFETAVRLSVSLGSDSDWEELKLLRSGNKTPENATFQLKTNKKLPLFCVFLLFLRVEKIAE